MSRLFLMAWLLAIVVSLQGCQLALLSKEDRIPITQQQRVKAASYNVQLGIGYLRKGKRIRAKKKLLKALALMPESAEVQSALAYYFESTGDVRKAEDCYQKALRIAPKTGTVLNNYGVFLCKHGEYLAAESFFLKAVEDTYYLNTAGAYENAGLCAALIPDESKASNYFIKALLQDPKRAARIEKLVHDLAQQQRLQKLELVYRQHLKDY